MTAGDRTPAASMSSPSRASVDSVTRSPSVDAFSTTTAGVAASIPRSTSSAAMARALRTAMMSTVVPASPRPRPSPRVTGVPRRDVARHDGEVVVQPAVRERQSGEGRRGRRRGHPGHDGDGHPGGLARPDLLEPAPEDERVPALEPDHAESRACPLDHELVDPLLGDLAAVGDLRDVDDLRPASGGLRGEVDGPEVVGEDDVRLRDRACPRDGHEPRIARSSPTSVTRPTPPPPLPRSARARPRRSSTGQPRAAAHAHAASADPSAVPAGTCTRPTATSGPGAVRGARPGDGVEPDDDGLGPGLPHELRGDRRPGAVGDEDTDAGQSEGHAHRV